MDEFKIPSLPSSSAPKVENTNKDNDDKTVEVPKTISQDSKEVSGAPTPVSPYKIPNWSSPPSDQNVNYKFEILKSGQIIEEIDNLQKQAHWTFGRLNENDIVLAHPTISRFHAVLQYRPHVDQDDETNSSKVDDKNPPEGWYIYDLGSTHGTFLNKQRLPAKVFIRIRVGHMLKLGASTRSFILQGPIDDEEPESELSITELREQRERRQQEAAEAKQQAEENERIRKENEGISWGMSEDANEETDLTHNPYASSNNEDYFATNPKQALRHFFEREDMPLEYRCDEMSLGSFICKIDLPVDDDNGRPITAEVVHKGKKKDCVFQCALEACRILDRLGVLRQKNQEPLARRKKPSSDSDEDDFWDRTGDIARKKERKANANTSVTLTYDDLLKQEKNLVVELEKLEANIAVYQAKQKRLKEQAEAQNEADLDSFMENLNDDVSQLDKTEIKKLRLEQQRLKTEQQRLRRLIKIAKPYELPFPKVIGTDNSNSTAAATSSVKKQLPMIGKRNQFSKFKVIKPTNNAPATSNKTYASDEEEMDEEENQEMTKVCKKGSQESPKLADVETKSINTTNKNEMQTKVDVITQESTRSKKLPTATEEPTSSADSSTNQRTKEKLTPVIDSKTRISLTEDATSSVELDSKNLNLETESSPPTKQQDEEIESLNAENSRKRARQRPRLRGKRQDIDVEDLEEHESSEKYAKWVPPANQTGDGYTALNEKFGY